MSPEEWISTHGPIRRGWEADPAGRAAERPRRSAKGRPDHGVFRIRSAGGAEHEIESSTFPIVASEEGSSGAMVLFWPLNGERPGRGSAMKVKVWGARGSVPAPGPKMNRYGGNTSCVQLTLVERRGPDPRRGHRDPHARPRPGHRAEGQHPAHPPAPRPHPGPDVLPALLPLRRGDHDLGARLAGGLAGGPGRPLHLRSAVAGRGARAALLGLLSRHAAERVADRLGDDPHGGGQPPRADAWLPDHRRRDDALLHPRPRARARREPRRPGAGVDLRLRPGSRRRPPDPRLPVHRRRSTPSTSAGATPGSTTR